MQTFQTRSRTIMSLSITGAKQLAVKFLVEDLEIPEGDRDYFAALSAKQSGSDWYIVEVGIEGLPDKWAIQVYDTHQCDPCYTFISPMPAFEDADLEEFPESIAEIVSTERAGGRA